MKLVASVTMKELSFRRVITNPLNSPAIVPTSSAATTAANAPVCRSCINSPTVTTLMPPIYPSERFIPPTIITIVCERAMNM